MPLSLRRGRPEMSPDIRRAGAGWGLDFPSHFFFAFSEPCFSIFVALLLIVKVTLDGKKIL